MSTAKPAPPKAAAAKAAPARKRGLGRGLEALLGPKAAAEAPKLEAEPGDVLRNLPVDALRAGKYQPRKHWDGDRLDELAESIRAQAVTGVSGMKKSQKPGFSRFRIHCRFFRSFPAKNRRPKAMVQVQP